MPAMSAQIDRYQCRVVGDGSTEYYNSHRYRGSVRRQRFVTAATAHRGYETHGIFTDSDGDFEDLSQIGRDSIAANASMLGG